MEVTDMMTPSWACIATKVRLTPAMYCASVYSNGSILKSTMTRHPMPASTASAWSITLLRGKEKKAVSKPTQISESCGRKGGRRGGGVGGEGMGKEAETRSIDGNMFQRAGTPGERQQQAGALVKTNKLARPHASHLLLFERQS